MKCCAYAAFAGVVIALWASGSSVNAGVVIRPLAATFTPIGDDPNVEWSADPSSHFHGTVHSVDTAGVPNMLVNFDVDPELDALGDLQATMQVSGFYLQYHSTQPLLWANLDFYYAGDTPISVGGVDYAKGAHLLGFRVGAWTYHFGLGPFGGYGLHSGLKGVGGSVASHGVISADVLPILQPDPKFAGWSYILPGQAQWSGQVVGDYVPEPSIWALLILGFGATGAVLRRRERATLS